MLGLAGLVFATLAARPTAGDILGLYVAHEDGAAMLQMPGYLGFLVPA